MMAWLKDLLGGKAHDDSARWEPGDTLAKQLALVIDLNVCVGCHACVTSCKEWNTSGSAGRSGLIRDQCACQGAPSWIQLRTASICFGFRTCCDFDSHCRPEALPPRCCAS